MNDKFLKRPILVTGLARSGTSLTAGLFDVCGAWSGSTVLASKDNIKGFYEHGGLREHINKALLKNMGCDPLGVRVLPQTELPEIHNFKENITDIILGDGYDGKVPWMFKDAKLLLLWPYYKKYFPNATWVLVRRDREEIIDSCLRTGFMKQHSEDRAYWEKWALDYENRMALLKASGVKYHEIWTKDIVKPESRDVLKKLVKKLKLKWNEVSVQNFIEPSVWHDRK